MNNNYKYSWTKEKKRYYNIYLDKGLFNDWTITCVWGGVNSRLGNYKLYAFDDIQEAYNMIEHIIKRRLKRGYTRIKS